MRNSTRFVIAAAAAGTVLAALAGCTASPTEGSGSPSPTQAATTTAAAPTATATTTSAPAPTTAPTNAPAEQPTATPTPTRSALAQHIFDECNKGAADAGVVLEFTAEPSGYAAADDYQLVYPIARFVDGHTDEWAIYTCTLTDDTVHSTFVSGGVTDAH